MDVLAGMLDGPRARGAFAIRSVMSPPWSMLIKDQAPLTVVAVVHGEAWVLPRDIPAVRLRAGDVAVARGPDPYVVADDPATPPRIVIHPGQVCTTLSGASLAAQMDLGVRTWGNQRDGATAPPTTMLTGTYQQHSEVSRRLLDALPALAVIRADDWDCPLVPMLAQEIGRDDPGQAAVLDRLLDLLLVTALRAWFARPDTDAPPWWRANGDPVVGHALRLLHNHPERPWTIAALATATGVSRASFARRFAGLVGEPPIAFLTGWRLTLAADLLQEPAATVGAVARQVGYGSPFALSTAFRRRYGVSPQQYRARAHGDRADQPPSDGRPADAPG